MLYLTSNSVQPWSLRLICICWVTGTGIESLKYRDEEHGGLHYYVNQAGDRILLDSHSATVPSDSYYPFILHDGVITPGVTPDGKPNEMVIPAEQYYGNLYWQSDMSMSEDLIYKSDYICIAFVVCELQFAEELRAEV